MGRAISGTVVALAFAIAGCGGDEEPSEPKQPKLPPELAATLAAQSDQIAENLAAGEECAAYLQAQALRAQVGDAVASGVVPPSLGREMSAGASSLSDGIQCEPDQQPPAETQETTAPPPTECEQIMAQLTQLRTQWEQAKQQEKAAHGQDKKAAKDLQKQLEDQAEPLIEQFRDQCDGEEGEPPGFGGDEQAPPGQGGDSPGRGDGRGGGGGDD
jgi:hypothetical protein